MKFKEGQRVWSSKRGWGVISIISNAKGYPLLVDFDDGPKESYTIDGRDWLNDLLPTLFLDEVKDWPDPPAPRPDLEVDQPIWVRCLSEGKWKKRHFCRWSVNGKAVCFSKGRTSWTDTEEAVQWDEYSLEDPNVSG